MRNLVFTGLLPCALVGAVSLSSSASSAHGHAHFDRNSTVAVFGDAPYGTGPTDSTQFDATTAFIDSVNADTDVGLVLHVGDIHAGSQYCTEDYDEAVYDLWRDFDDPLIYTPGDNEWADCHKKKEGGGSYNGETGEIDYVLDDEGNPVNYAGGDPIANLELIRSIFFARPGHTLGGHKVVLSQHAVRSPGHPSDRKFVENVMWTQSDVLFLAVNLPGGSNNDQDVWYGAPTESSAQTQEREERTGADLRWLDLGFNAARLLHSRAVVIVAQADMWDPEKGMEHQAGFEPIVSNIADHTLAFGHPVLMFNGDSHEYLSDNPLSAADPLNYMHPGYDVPNFHRVVVHGSTTPLEWLKVTVDPDVDAPASDSAFGPFSWVRMPQ